MRSVSDGDYCVNNCLLLRQAITEVFNLCHSVIGLHGIPNIDRLGNSERQLKSECLNFALMIIRLKETWNLPSTEGSSSPTSTKLSKYPSYSMLPESCDLCPS